MDSDVKVSTRPWATRGGRWLLDVNYQRTLPLSRRAAAPRPSLSGATRRAPLAPSTSAWAAAPHADHVDCRYAYQDQALHPTPATARLRRLRSPPRPPQRPPLLQPPHRHPPPVSPLLGRTRRRRRAPPRPHPPASHAKHMTISLAQISRQRVAGGTRYDARADHG